MNRGLYLRRAAASLVAMLFVSGALAAGAPPKEALASGGTMVTPGEALQFPRDYGSHPSFGIEWWYVTGWLTTGEHRPLGFQVTFFRVRPAIDANNPSAFTAHQLLIGHCALSDPLQARLLTDQRIRREGLGLAEATVGNTDVWIDDWQLQRTGKNGPQSYVLRIAATPFTLELSLQAAQPPMLNGVAGFSQKGPELASASYYYSQPHLRVRGRVIRGNRSSSVTGEAWLDHEWASEYLDSAASGWDWVGLNLADGGAVMAFEIRDRRGQRYWAGATVRDAHGQLQHFSPQQIQFQPLRYWRSPHSGVAYPVAERLRLGSQVFDVEPLMDDQEFDARLSSAALYWEGAVRVEAAAARAGRPVSIGEGYLELTGYDRPLSLR